MVSIHTEVCISQFSHSVVSDSLRPRESQHARPPCPSPTPGVQLKLMSIELVIPSSHLILCRPLLLLPAIPPSIRVFSNESTLCMRWPKYWSFSFSIGSSNEHPGLISFILAIRTWGRNPNTIVVQSWNFVYLFETPTLRTFPKCSSGNTES